MNFPSGLQLFPYIYGPVLHLFANTFNIFDCLCVCSLNFPLNLLILSLINELSNVCLHLHEIYDFMTLYFKKVPPFPQ